MDTIQDPRQGDIEDAIQAADAEKTRGWIGVDLDRTLAHYDHYRGPFHIGVPIKPMVDRVKQWIAEGKDVRVFTARVAHDPSVVDLNAVVIGIRQWTLDHIGKELPVTCIKDMHCVEIWDDRAVSVLSNNGDAVRLAWSDWGVPFIDYPMGEGS